MSLLSPVSSDRERFATRIGFLLAASGSAVGLANIWRFPYMVGTNGGSLFIFTYVIILLTVGLHILLTELAVGRGAARSLGSSFETLKPNGKPWHWLKYPMILGNYVVMCYYPVITGWIIYYFFGIISGELLSSPKTSHIEFLSMIQQDTHMVYLCSMLALFSCTLVCWFGVKKGLETVSKPLMTALLVMLIVLAGYALSLDGAMEGVKKYLIPDFSTLHADSFFDIVRSALAQSVFSLGVGVGIITAFASYQSKERTLVSESLVIVSVDTFVAITAGLVIFPACASFGIETTAGPSLLFESMLDIFRRMTGGIYFGSAFFLLMIFAAITSVISIFENLNAIVMDMFKVSRHYAVIINTLICFLLMTPVAYCFSAGEKITLFGYDLMTVADFIFSNILMPFGSFVLVVFCINRFGWGSKNFLAEVNTGTGWRLPRFVNYYIGWFVPVFIIFIFVSTAFGPEALVNFIAWFKKFF